MADTSDVVTLFSEGLLSKWGFGDGDCLDDVLYDWADENGIPYSRLNDHAVLIRLVREYVLPALDQQVVAYTISTIHNPIRAKAIDGVPLAEAVIYGDAPRPPLTPAMVDVPLSVVHDIARQTLLAEPRF